MTSVERRRVPHAVLPAVVVDATRPIGDCRVDLHADQAIGRDVADVAAIAQRKQRPVVEPIALRQQLIVRKHYQFFIDHLGGRVGGKTWVGARNGVLLGRE